MPDIWHSAGALILVDFDPQVGHEQRGKRPALVVSPVGYNESSSFVVVCPITTSSKSWPFKVPLPEDSKVKGYILADQIKSVDQRRVVRYLGRIDDITLDAVRDLIVALVEKQPNGNP